MDMYVIIDISSETCPHVIVYNDKTVYLENSLSWPICTFLTIPNYYFIGIFMIPINHQKLTDGLSI